MMLTEIKIDFKVLSWAGLFIGQFSWLGPNPGALAGPGLFFVKKFSNFFKKIHNIYKIFFRFISALDMVAQENFLYYRLKYQT